ncbi:MAG TPA: hypothetical protein VFO86_06985, partial [Terriglobia bacterium]|nr:hypothetical protein [Terriglobia bacterium]
MRSNRIENIMVANKSAFELPARLPLEKKEERSSELQIVVLYTTPEMTRQALQYAATMGNGLAPNVSLLEIEVVPYAYSMDRPPIDPEFSRRRLEQVVRESGTCIRAEVLYARDRDAALMKRLGP